MLPYSTQDWVRHWDTKVFLISASVESDGRVSDDVVEKISRSSCRECRCDFFVVTLAGYPLSMVPLISSHISRKIEKTSKNPQL